MCRLNLFLFRFNKHWEKAPLHLNLDYIAGADRVGLPTFSTNWGNHLQIWALNERGVHIICVGWRNIVDALIKLRHGHDVTGFGYETRNIVQKLSLCRSTTVIIEKVEHPFVIPRIIG